MQLVGHAEEPYGHVMPALAHVEPNEGIDAGHSHFAFFTLHVPSTHVALSFAVVAHALV